MFAILTILCAMVILFTGGCALGLFVVGLVPVAAVLGGIAAANIAVIVSLYGHEKPPGIVYLLLAGLDFTLAGLMVAIVYIIPPDRAFNETEVQVRLVVGGLAALKGVLTIAAKARLDRRSAGHEADRSATR
jgi:hypothetical protein